MNQRGETGWDTRYKSNNRLSEAKWRCGLSLDPSSFSADFQVFARRGRSDAAAGRRGGSAVVSARCSVLTGGSVARRRSAGAHYCPGSPRSMLEPNIFTSCSS